MAGAQRLGVDIGVNLAQRAACHPALVLLIDARVLAALGALGQSLDRQVGHRQLVHRGQRPGPLRRAGQGSGLGVGNKDLQLVLPLRQVGFVAGTPPSHGAQGLRHIVRGVAPGDAVHAQLMQRFGQLLQGNRIGQHHHGAATQRGFQHNAGRLVAIQQLGALEQRQRFFIGVGLGRRDLQRVGAEVTQHAAALGVAVVVVSDLGALLRRHALTRVDSRQVDQRQVQALGAGVIAVVVGVDQLVVGVALVAAQQAGVVQHIAHGHPQVQGGLADDFGVHHDGRLARQVVTDLGDFGQARRPQMARDDRRVDIGFIAQLVQQTAQLVQQTDAGGLLAKRWGNDVVGLRVEPVVGAAGQ